MKKVRLFCLLLLLIAVSTVWWYEHGPLTLRGELELFVREQGLSRGAIAIARQGQVISKIQVGELEATPLDTQYPIASLSKLLTAQVVANLIIEGELHLSDRLFERLPELPYANDAGYQQITVRHLLQHTAGFDRSKSGDPLFNDDFSVRGCEAAARIAVSRPLEYEPGRATKYSNVGYCLLGMLIEQVTGQSYEAAMFQRLPQDKVNRLVFGRPIEGGIKIDTQFSSTEWSGLGAAGGWFSDAATLAQLLEAARSSALGLHPLPSELNHAFYYGNAWRTWLPPHHRLTHYGALPGFYSFAMKLADEYVVVALFKGRPNSDEDAAIKLIDIFERDLL